MTEERQNEIWDYLPNDIRIKLQRDYIKACEAQELDPRNERIYAHRMFMQKYFGRDNMEQCNELNEANLTAQAEEKPKEPRFNVGDKVVVASNESLAKCIGDECCVVTEVLPHGYHIDSPGKSWFAKDEDLAPCPFETDETTHKSPSEQNRSLSQDVADCDIETEEEEALLRMEYIAMMEEKKAELEKLREQMNDRHFQYRLDLAKEIAVAMIKSHNEPVLRSIAEVAVDTANEIVKRLKETEI